MLFSPLLHHVATRELSGFIFDSRPAYPWRRGAEFDLAVGSVGVLSTRAGGGGGWRCGEEEQPETHSTHNTHVGGTTGAAHTAAPPLGAGGSEHDAGLLCSIHTMSKDIH